MDSAEREGVWWGLLEGRRVGIGGVRGGGRVGMEWRGLGRLVSGRGGGGEGGKSGEEGLLGGVVLPVAGVVLPLPVVVLPFPGVIVVMGEVVRGEGRPWISKRPSEIERRP